MRNVSFYTSASTPSLYVGSAPKGSQYMHYSFKNGPFEKIVEGIKKGRWSNAIASIMKRGYDANKKHLPCFTPAGTFRIRIGWDLLEYSHLMHLDYDSVPVDRIEKLKKRLCKSPHVLAAFVSPGGKGIKLFVPITSPADHHAQAFTQVRKTFDELAGIVSDAKVRDIARLCFISQDPHAYYNESAKVYEISGDAFHPRVTIPDRAELSNPNTVFGWLYNLTVMGKYQGELLADYAPKVRNNFIFLFCCNCNRYGISLQTAFEFARNIWVQNNDGFSEGELHKTVNSAYAYRDQHNTFKLPKHLTNG